LLHPRELSLFTGPALNYAERGGMKRRVSSIFLCTALTVLTTAAPRVQTTSGTISGTVLDLQGALISGAKVSVTNENNAEVRSVNSSSNGDFSVPSLLPSVYTVRIEAPTHGPATSAPERAAELNGKLKLFWMGVDTEDSLYDGQTGSRLCSRRTVSSTPTGRSPARIPGSSGVSLNEATPLLWR
jgi:hypothetical protein